MPNRSLVYVGSPSGFWGLHTCVSRPRFPDQCNKVSNPGVAYEQLKYILGSHLGFDFVVKPSLDNKWGNTRGTTTEAIYNGSNGILRDLLDHRLDLSIPALDLTPRRFQAVHFTNVVNFRHRGFLVEKNFGLQGGDFQYWKIMSLSMWIYWLLLVSLLYILIVVTKFVRLENASKNMALLFIYILYQIMNASFGCFIISVRSIATTVLPFSTISAAGIAMLNDGFRLAAPSPSSASIQLPAELHVHFRKALDLFPIQITKSDANMVSLLVRYPRLFNYGNAEHNSMVARRHVGVKSIVDESAANSLEGIMVSAKYIGILKGMNSAILIMQESGIQDAIMRRYDLSTPDPTPEISVEMAGQTAFKISDFRTTMNVVILVYFGSSIYQVFEYGYFNLLSHINRHI